MQWHTVSSDSLLSYWTYIKFITVETPITQTRLLQRPGAVSQSITVQPARWCMRVDRISTAFAAAYFSSKSIKLSRCTCIHMLHHNSEAAVAEVCISRLNASLQAGGASPSSKAHLNVAFVYLDLEATRGPPSQKLCLCNTNLFSPSMLISLWFCLANIL